MPYAPTPTGFVFTGGYEAFAEQAQRLLATIARRGNIPLQANAATQARLRRATQRNAYFLWLNLLGIFFAMIVPLSLLAAFWANRIILPVIIADAEGLIRKTWHSPLTSAVPWTAITAWGVRQPEPGVYEYSVATHERTLVWRERADLKLAGFGVKGDRRTAYQERATQRHALIAAKTGLPLREMGGITARFDSLAVPGL